MSSLTGIRESFRVTTVQPQQGWYRENDLQEALTLRLDEQNLINRADLVVLAAIGGIEDGQQIFTHLQGEARRNVSVGARTILLPYNVNNAHWIGIVIQIPQDTMERVRVEIFDPLGEQAQIPGYVWRELRQVYPEAEFRRGRDLVQQDGYNCGPLTVEILVRRAMQIAGQDTRRLGTNAVETRAHQIELLRRLAHPVTHLIIPAAVSSMGRMVSSSAAHK
jgi:hypothetical protein